MSRKTSRPKKKTRKIGSKTRSKRRSHPPARTDTPPRLQRYASEQVLRAVSRVVSRHEFADIDEANRFLEEHVMGGKLDPVLREMMEDPQEKAQHFAFQAMEAESLEEMLLLAGQALALDSRNADALSLMIDVLASDDGERIKLLTVLVEEIEGSLGSDFFEENRGRFWGLVDTRPYMRVSERLMRALLRSGRRGEALRLCEKMLDLNPNDNQGIRDSLLGLYLAEGELSRARGLLERYPEPGFAVFQWGSVLERVLSGDLKGAGRHLREAERHNPYVRDYLTGRKKLPEELPDAFSPGDECEACLCVRELGEAWQSHPRAVDWLASLPPSR